jgi:S1-C subfamily serine protease
MRNEDAVANAVAAHKPGDSVQITVYRGNDKKTVTVELAKRPANASTSSQEEGGGGGVLP